MFFNFGPFSFGDAPRRPPNNPNINQQQGGPFGGLNDFLRDSFMNPFFGPMHQEQQPENPGPQPTFQRGSAQKKSQRQQKKDMKKEEPVYNENTGMFWKNKANQLYKQGKYQEALEHYHKAIQLNNTESVFFSNRARCLKKMGRFEQALKDARQAVELDVDNIKGHLLSGQLLAQFGKKSHDINKVENAIVRLKKALTLCYGQKKNEQFQQDISTYIYRAKKLLWYMKLEQVKSKRIKAINAYQDYLEKDGSINKEEKQYRLKQFIEASNEELVFHIPDYLCCRITLDLMEEPVVTDSGQVYEKSAIQQHIQRNGKTDPFTRKPITGNLYPCISIKKAIEDFLSKNPWAYEYMEGQSYHDIPF